jgi:hypothetical protein
VKKEKGKVFDFHGFLGERECDIPAKAYIYLDISDEEIMRIFLRKNSPLSDCGLNARPKSKGCVFWSVFAEHSPQSFDFSAEFCTVLPKVHDC